jgi:hypothetical protein
MEGKALLISKMEKELSFYLRKITKASFFARRKVSFLQLNTLENWYFVTSLFTSTEGILI